jgi:hypothetical protein
MTDQHAYCQQQAFKDRRSNQERLLPNANDRRVPGGSVKKLDAIQEFGHETTSVVLNEFVYREASEFEMIRTTTGREIKRETFVGVIGKQEKLKRGRNEESTRDRKEEMFWIIQRWDWYDDHYWKCVRSRPG